MCAFCCRTVSKIVPAGSSRCLAVQEFSACRADHEVLRLHARQLAVSSPDVPAPDVAGLGLGVGSLSLPAASSSRVRRQLRSFAVLRRAAHCVPGEWQAMFAPTACQATVVLQIKNDSENDNSEEGFIDS